MSIKVSKNFMALVLVTSIAGGMIGTKAIGVWSDTDGLTQAVENAKKDLNKEQSKEVSTSVNTEENKPNDNNLNISVSEIKGSSSFGQVAEVYFVNIDDLIKAFSLNNNSITAENKIKDLVTIFGEEDEKEGGIGTASVRYFVAIYVGENYVNEEEVYLPVAAVELLDELGKLDNDSKEYLKTHTVVK